MTGIELKVLDKEFQNLLDKTYKLTKDLTVPLTLIYQEWLKGNRAIFSLKGKGKYEDLSAGYKITKQKQWGFVYPILRASGRLEGSITNAGDPEAIGQIINKKNLLMGTKVPYAIFPQMGTRFMPPRPPILFGPEQVGDKIPNQRLERWKEILLSWCLQGSKI